MEIKLIVKLPLSVAMVIREKPVPTGAEETTLGPGVGLLVGKGVEETVGVEEGMGVRAGVGLGEASMVGEREGVTGLVFGKSPSFPITINDAIRAIIKRGISWITPESLWAENIFYIL